MFGEYPPSVNHPFYMLLLPGAESDAVQNNVCAPLVALMAGDAIVTVQWLWQHH